MQNSNNMPEDLLVQHAKALNSIWGYPADYRRIAKKRFLLIKEFEVLLENEVALSNAKRIKMKILKAFCDEKGISPKTFCKHQKLEREGGIEALLPKWAKKQKGRNQWKDYNEDVLQCLAPAIPYSADHPENAGFADASEQLWETFRIQYAKELDRIGNLPDFKRMHAERQFLLIKEFEMFMENEAAISDVKRRKMKLLKAFCDEKEIRLKTFCRHLNLERQGGIEALVPKWGKNKGKRKLEDSLLPIIKKTLQPGKGIQWLYDEMIRICSEREIELPGYHTIRRMCRDNGLLDAARKRKKAYLNSIRAAQVDDQKKISAEIPKRYRNDEIPKRYRNDEIPKRYRHPAPKWLRVSNRRAFDVAMYKYNLVTPFLDPELSKKDVKQMMAEITATEHYPSPRVTLKISRQALKNYISIVREYGCEGLFRKEGAYYDRRHKNLIWSTFKIDMNDPLGALSQLQAAIERGPNVSPDGKEIALRFLDRCMASIDDHPTRYKPMYLDRPLTIEEREKLEKYERGTHKNQKARAKGLLMANENFTMPEIIMATGRSSQTIYRWFGLFKKRGIDFVETKIDRKKYDMEMKERKDRIVKILHTKPSDYDINKTEWILDDISKVYEKKYGRRFSTTTIRRAIKQANYSWKRAKKVLTSPDPEFREKTKKVLETLRNLKQNEAFFFIDEGGPHAIKKYGGQSFTPKGTVKTYPQFQTKKGSVTFIGALDAIKNQVILFFSKSKDTGAVIALIKVLFYKYHEMESLYLTWDAASWHSSKKLKKFLDELNSKESGPTIKVVPLPKQSQFLNVIEAVFSGMKRAVIFNSDYGSEYEMKAAIVRHFRERNEYFKANPKRAGKKIWDQENFDLDKLESGLYKRM